MISNVDLSLLEETYQNATMGIAAIESVLDKASSKNFANDLMQQMRDYEELADKSREQLMKHGAKAKEKSLIDRTMLKGNIMVNTISDSSDSHIAEMVIKGSTMGITQMTKLLNDKDQADGVSKNIANDFIKKEEKNIKVMKSYL